MRYVYGLTAALLLGGTAIAISSHEPLDAQPPQNEGIQTPVAPGGAPASFADMVERLQPAVVNISTRQRVQARRNPLDDLFGNLLGGPGGADRPQIQEGTSLGAGFLISADGYIVTNSHVVSPGGPNATVEAITVTMNDHTEYAAELVGRDEVADLAVLKIKTSKPMPYVRFGTTKSARVGDWVIVIGQPLGLEGTVTTGIISNIARTTGSGSPYDRFIQTDASINQGNSGGPMFDLKGNVLGVNTWIASPNGGNIGLGFAIPGEIARPIVEKLMRGEKIERGYIGIGYSQINDKLARALGVDKNHGVFVNAVPSDGPAGRAGIQPRDVILSVGGKDVNIDNPLSVIVADLQIGKPVPVELIRDGKRRTVSVTLGRRPSEKELSGGFLPDDEPQAAPSTPQQSYVPRYPNENGIGLALLEINPAIRRQLGLDDSVEGVVVNGVNPQSDAAIVGIQRGDMILEVDGRKVRTAADVKGAVAAARTAGKSAVLLLIARPSARFRGYVPVELTK
ncbi:trypsin-like peptidase domain-containing protein [Sphingobium fluviale]|uniref:Probable periplasmic serine endoprotease DegP-like n=1 Tax=Sphingobium fluviale TaxID=2506423 RepID=A0A4Q1KME1_9SPHN|nr:trypsin-like peptidase domain-containing protein [Sphingobium fluviale]RXR30359.1 PDZ domain-containing protein [Sphingobium fluviale]